MNQEQRTTKPAVFIGSSVEGRRLAEALQVELESESKPTVWSQALFQPGKGFLEVLVESLNRFDFAVLILTPDDIVIQRGTPGCSPRDNVIFEAGLFIGSLGRERTFLVRPTDVESFSLFTDYAGVTTPDYSYERFQAEGRAALGTAAAIIKEEIRKRGPREPEPLAKLGLTQHDISEFYRRTGLTYAFGKRRESTDRMLSDISAATKSIRMYSRVYISELLKGVSDLSHAISQAARMSPGTDQRKELLVSHTSTASNDKELARTAWHQEDPKQIRWPVFEGYQAHLKSSDVLFSELCNALGRDLAGAGTSDRAMVRVERRYLVNCVLPHSLLVVDDAVLYVSFYALSADRIGTYAPTMRLACDASETDSWAASFVNYTNEIDREYSRIGIPSKLI